MTPNERAPIVPRQGPIGASRPTKTSDSRSKGFKGESVEVDAIAPATLRRIAEECITKHIDEQAYARLKAVERYERDTLRTIAANSEFWRRSHDAEYPGSDD